MDDADGTKRQPRRRRRVGRFAGWWPVLALAVVALLYGGFAGLVWWLQADAHKFGTRLTQEFPGDEVEALLALVQSSRHSLGERNHAVHALGQIGDRRALPTLERFYTGRECDHSKFLCQKELRKAIDRSSGKNWAPGWLPLFPRPPQNVRGG